MAEAPMAIRRFQRRYGPNGQIVPFDGLEGLTVEEGLESDAPRYSKKWWRENKLLSAFLDGTITGKHPALLEIARDPDLPRLLAKHAEDSAEARVQPDPVEAILQRVEQRAMKVLLEKGLPTEHGRCKG